MTRPLYNAVITLFFLAGNSEAAAQIQKILNPFDTLQYDKVVAYDYNGMNNQPIVKDGELIKPSEGSGRFVKIYSQKELTKKQVATLHKIIGDTATYGGPTAACFDPHLGVVYYQKDKIVGHISICIDCNFLRASMSIPVSRAKKIYYGDDSDNFLYAEGFSKPARKKLNAFCKELQFTTCKDNLDSILFDK